MGIAEARTFHEIKLVLQSNFSESMLADAAVNPTYSTVKQWHTIWRTEHLGPTDGFEMIAVSVLLLLTGRGSYGQLLFSKSAHH